MTKSITGPERPIPVPLLGTSGDTGLNVFGDGRIREEFHRNLTGDRFIQRIVKEMLYNEPYLAAPFWLMEAMVKSTNRTVKMATKGHPQSAEAQEYIDSAIHDMESTMQEILGEAMTAWAYGWSYNEIEYKIRKGESVEPRLNSKHDDGRYGWRDWSPRSQASREQWAFTDEGRLLGMWQRVDRKANRLFVPIMKAPGIGGVVHFRFRGSKKNPEGFSCFRPTYVPYYFATNLRITESIALERDGAGLPVAWIPADVLNAAAEGDPTAVTTVANFTDIVKKIRFDKQGGLVFPAKVNSDGTQSGFDFTLLSASGKNIAAYDVAIQRYQIGMLTAQLMQFLSFGVTDTGSRSLGDSMTSNVGYATAAVNKSIDETITNQAFPGLLRLEGFHPDSWPSMFSADVEKQKLADSGNFLNQMITGGVIRPTKRVEDYALRQLDMDPEDDLSFEDTVVEDDLDPEIPDESPDEVIAEPDQMDLPLEEAEEPKEILTLQEAADELGIDASVIRRAIKNKKLKGIQIGRQVRVRRSDLDEAFGTG